MKNLIFVLFLFLFVSCEKETIEPNMKPLTLEIGNWNMTDNESISIKMPYESERISEVTAYIMHDGLNSACIPLVSWESRINDFRGEIKIIDYYVILTRKNNSLFSIEAYNDDINRGFIVIEFE